MYVIGVDLGQSQDYTAIAIIEQLKQEGGAVYHVRKLERTRGTPYPDVVARVKDILQRLPGAELVADQTGVGAPVVDMFVRADLKPIGIYIHGGDRVTHEGSTWRVPKRDLVGVLQVLLQNQRLKIAQSSLSDILASEMLNFKVKIDPATAHDSYSAWREQEHDDLVLSVALAAWWGEHRPEVITISIPDRPITGRPYLGPGGEESWLAEEQRRLWGYD
jgi:hypothetical protein